MEHSTCLSVLPWALTAAAASYAIYLTLKPTKSTSCCRFNKSIELNSPKVVHTYDVNDLEKKTCYCRCWKSKKFPYCDGSHNEYNKETGDNLGPLVIQKSDK